MLSFIAAAAAAAEGIDIARPEDSSVSADTLKTLTDLVIRRFLENVDWDSIAEIYLSGLVDDEDLALIKRAVNARAAGFIANG